MKVRNIVFVMLVAISFVACNNGNNDQEPIVPSSEIKGIYNGTVIAKAGPQSYDPVDCRVEVKLPGDGKITVLWPELTIGQNKTMPAMAIKNIVVKSEVNGVYTLAETPINEKINDKKYTGTISGTIGQGSANILYSIKPGMMPFPIKFTFTGSKNNE